MSVYIIQGMHHRLKTHIMMRLGLSMEFIRQDMCIQKLKVKQGATGDSLTKWVCQKEDISCFVFGTMTKNNYDRQNKIELIYFFSLKKNTVNMLSY